jgi:hypothetical protein
METLSKIEIPKEVMEKLRNLLGTYLTDGMRLFIRIQELNISSEELNETNCKQIRSLFWQLLSGKGWKSDCPIKNVNIQNFHRGLEILGYVQVQQAATSQDKGKTFLDKMVFKHVYNKQLSPITFYNLVDDSEHG